MDTELTLEQLRGEVQRAIRETSARSVARELVVSPTGLLKFAENPRSTIYRKTHEKLVSWYHRRAAGSLMAPKPDAAEAAVDAAVGE
jgi:hypothetical protein